jgi:hypothetical protein
MPPITLKRLLISTALVAAGFSASAVGHSLLNTDFGQVGALLYVGSWSLMGIAAVVPFQLSAERTLLWSIWMAVFGALARIAVLLFLDDRGS